MIIILVSDYSLKQPEQEGVGVVAATVVVVVAATVVVLVVAVVEVAVVGAFVTVKLGGLTLQ